MTKKPPSKPSDFADDQSTHRPSPSGERQSLTSQDGCAFTLLIDMCDHICESHHLDQLLRMVATQVRSVVPSEGSVILLCDRVEKGLVPAAMSFDHDELETIFKSDFKMIGQRLAGRVCETGTPFLENEFDGSRTGHLAPEGSDVKRIVTRMVVPLNVSNRTAGVVIMVNKRDGLYNDADMALLGTVSGLTALAMENIQARESLLDYRRQLENFNYARDRVIHQFSHALKTPLAVLIASLKLLRRHLNRSTDEAWLPVYDRAQRNLVRLLSIEYEMEDILGQRQDSTQTTASVSDQTAGRTNADLDASEQQGPRVKKKAPI